MRRGAWDLNKIRIDRGADSRTELDDSLAGAWRLLQSETTQDLRDRLHLLTEVLRQQASPSFSEGHSHRQLADLLALLLDSLENRTFSASVRLLPIDHPGHSLLLTCSRDVPFLFDAVQTFLKNSQVRFQVLAHPLLYTRVINGERRLTAPKAEGSERESVMVILLKGFIGENEKEFAQKLQQVMDDLVCLEGDREQLDDRLASLQTAAARENFSDFWFWLKDGNFRPFSYRCLSVWQTADGGYWVRQKTAKTLGMPSHPPELTCCEAHPLAALDALFREQLIRPGPVVVSRTQRPSPIHHAEHLSCLGFREKTADGWLEHVFLGVFTPRSVQQSNCDVPALQQRIGQALDELGIPPDSHDYRKTVDFLDTFPKIELFFMEPAELRQVARNITWLYRHEAVRIVAVPSLATEGVTLVVMMPREFYSADSLLRLEAYLSRRSRASFVDIQVIQISVDFVSLHVRLGSPDQETRLDLERLEGGLTRMFQPWPVKLRRLLEKQYGAQKGFTLWQRYRNAFSREYRTLVHPRFALRDVHEVERVLRGEGEGFALWGPLGSFGQGWRLQFYSHRQSSLNEILPVLENFGLSVLEEVDFEVVESFRRIFIKSFSIRPAIDETDLTEHRDLLLEALMAVRRGQVENDSLNRLLLACGLSWREIDVFRGYRNYYLQLGAPFGKERIALALIRNFDATLLLFRYFKARFKGYAEAEERILPPLRQELAVVLERVADINEDRILRAFFNLLDSTVRTNFFVPSGSEHAFSFKISSLGILEMPSPRPLYEIYVHNAAMEGIHLRGGKIARGGIRWSDRLDFRTEILDLVKIQITKNALIVPTGSKGGFILKPTDSGEPAAARAIVAYRDFIRGLLDLTDNRVAGQVVHPQGLAVYDGEDPYLVVAADKGTAKLSDVANEVAAEYDFWLGDAFASGGSHGYDHKKLGITARGAWVSVQRHFRELELDIQRQPFSVIGIGDMSGDVFGNGMLQSDKIRLLAAFDHRHIFLDPAPDPFTSSAERKRLFGLPHSSWDNYDRSLLSPGGGVFHRDTKDILLSLEVRQWLGCRHTSIDGPGLIRLILTAEADLLWNGGVGTYVKGSTETHQDVADRGNDGVRVDGGQLRVRVVGEGGNLGFTQRARVEYALTGGKINVDAIDNVGGVDCSDHEVNIKILLQQLLDREVLTSQEERDRLLEELTEDVCESVLQDCYQQGLCLSLDLERCTEKLESFFVLNERLENMGILNPQVENLPPPKAVLTRPGKALTRPELAVLMAYGKIDLMQNLLGSDLPDSVVGHAFISDYFPEPLRRQFGRQLLDHPLAPEIAATAMSNTVINQAGSSFVSRIWEQTGASSVDVVRTYLTFDEALQGKAIRRPIYFMDSKLTASRQYQLLGRLEKILENMCLWALVQHLDSVPEKAVIEAFRVDIEEYLSHLEKLLPAPDWLDCLAEETRLQNEGFAADLAQRMARLPYLSDFLPIRTLQGRTGGDLLAVAQLFNKIRDAFSIPEVLRQLSKVPVHRRWDRMARQSLEVKFNALKLELPLAVCEKFDGDLRRFMGERPGGMQTYIGLLNRLKEGPAGNCHPFTVLAAALEAMLP